PYWTSCRAVEPDVAAHHYVNIDRAALGDPEADGGLAPFAFVARRLGRSEVAARAVVARRLAPRQCGPPLRLELFLRAVAPERRAALEQFRRRVAVERAALALAVRPHRPFPIGPFDARPLLPLEAEPQEILDHLGLGARDVPFDVGVLDAQ